MSRRLSDLEIAVRIVPTMLRWPSSDSRAWQCLHDGVDALRKMLRSLDDECQEIEHDRELNAAAIAQRREELGRQVLEELMTFGQLQSAERAVADEVKQLEPKNQSLLTKALNELRDGVEAARRAVVERCERRTFARSNVRFRG